ncbi:putative fatty acyl-CoA reductase CG8306 [Chironomus tepperi]|uniref:putative fatty acyl-CoA reductase CG8306 n=1 Tax=Chironomus tepperi TaxID=113505 RepID=UPI00391F03DD
MTSNVADFYRNKNVFITGGTGFVGIALVEKILRSTDVGKVYMLIRPKKGKSIEERLQDITKNAVFSKLLEEKSPDVFQKLIAVSGDVGEENLGLSASDRELLVNNVNIVIHSAATLDFQAALRPTVMINLLGTRQVMELCKQVKNLNSMVHISSAYVNSFLLETEEKLYPQPEDADKVIEIVKSKNDAELDLMTPGLIKDHPNTYTFTKHLAEHEVAKCASVVHAGIIRPSMITASWNEPVKGWTISKNGPQGFLMGASKGVIRRLPVDPKLIYDYIPVDMVVNQVIATAYHVAQKKSGELSIFHCTTSSCNPFKWDILGEKTNELLTMFPLKSAVWYPYLKFSPSLFLFKLSAILIHFIPAYILDFVTRIAGGRPILVRLHTNVWDSLKLLERFIFTEWKFHNKNTQLLSKTMSPVDQEKFNFDVMPLDWVDYFTNLAQGVRIYLNNEPLKTLPAAKKKHKILLILHILLQVSIHCGVWKLVATILGVPMMKCILALPLSYFILGLL